MALNIYQLDLGKKTPFIYIFQTFYPSNVAAKYSLIRTEDAPSAFFLTFLGSH